MTIVDFRNGGHSISKYSGTIIYGGNFAIESSKAEPDQTYCGQIRPKYEKPACRAIAAGQTLTQGATLRGLIGDIDRLIR
jgi:hypothetical protein